MCFYIDLQTEKALISPFLVGWEDFQFSVSFFFLFFFFEGLEGLIILTHALVDLQYHYLWCVAIISAIPLLKDIDFKFLISDMYP